MGCLEGEAEALGSVVQKQTTPQGGWSARDKQTRPLLAFPIGERRRDRAPQLGATMPER